MTEDRLSGLIERGIRKGPDFLPIARVILAPTPQSADYESYLNRVYALIQDRRAEEEHAEILHAGKNAEGNYAPRLNKLCLLEKWFGMRLKALALCGQDLR